jgi:tRNA(fMet)-specific endonuclease VapC
MIRYLLDTDTVSNLVRQPHGTVAERIAMYGEDRVATSLISAAELRYGAEKSGRATLVAQVGIILDRLAVLPIGPPSDLYYGKIRADLDKRGTPIGANDLLIAVQAVALGLVLVTGNVREFARIDGLICQNWLKSGRA